NEEAVHAGPGQAEGGEGISPRSSRRGNHTDADIMPEHDQRDGQTADTVQLGHTDLLLLPHEEAYRGLGRSQRRASHPALLVVPRSDKGSATAKPAGGPARRSAAVSPFRVCSGSPPSPPRGEGLSVQALIPSGDS